MALGFSGRKGRGFHTNLVLTHPEASKSVPPVSPAIKAGNGTVEFCNTLTR